MRNAIAQSIRLNLKAYNVAAFCDRIGVPARGEEGDPFASKAVFVGHRLEGLDMPSLLRVARRLTSEWDDPELEQLLGGLGGRGVNGELINIIFAADGPKPHIVLRDAINNQIEIAKHAQHCLVYDRPLSGEGLTWGNLLDWWVEKTAPSGQEPDTLAASRMLWQRLNLSLASAPEHQLFRAYTARYGAQDGMCTPALLPQVYLHYDPFSHLGLRTVVRQRMDFLILLPNRVRVVIEVDGIHHYADDSRRGDPARYASMVAEDRRLRLSGYEVYRFGGSEFVDSSSAEKALSQFFDQLLEVHSA